jgi:hypothetical protein
MFLSGSFSSPGENEGTSRIDWIDETNIGINESFEDPIPQFI